MANPKVKAILVGESNPYGADPAYALWPEPENASGARLVAIMGMSVRRYLETFDRTNLCTGDWEPRLAQIAAAEVRGNYERIILLGRRVCEAFEVPWKVMEVTVVGLQPRRRALVLPHPSGLNRLWNDPAASSTARAAVEAFLADARPERRDECRS